MTWEDKMPEIVQHIKTDTAGLYIMMSVLYLLISFGIFSTLLMMFAERQREFGMLVALGMRKQKIAGMLMVESALLTFLGCLTGLALSLPATWYLTAHPIRFSGEFAKVYEQFGFEAIFPATMKAQIFLNQTMIVMAIGLALSMYPLIRIFRLDPVAAMRR
jgi:ABC-type lipoprotein release transport system permease subunit